jgi:ABC-type transport system substrate-binding protein
VAAGVIKPGEPLPPLTLDIGGQQEDQRRMGEFIQGQFRKIGIDLKIELNDWPTQQKKVHNKQCQIYAMGWHADYPDPENFLQLYYTPNIERGTNNCNYSNPEFDAMYEQVAVMPPSPRRTGTYVKMIRMLNEDCPVLLLTEPISFVLVQPWVHNLKPHPFPYGFGRYTRIDVEARRKAGGEGGE